MEIIGPESFFADRWEAEAQRGAVTAQDHTAMRGRNKTRDGDSCIDSWGRVPSVIPLICSR